MAASTIRLAAALAAAWEAEILSQRVMIELADLTPDRSVRSRLLAFSAVCQAHASRLLGRLASMGSGPLPVPPDEWELDADLGEAIRREGFRARASSVRYGQIADQCRMLNDPAAAWVCELNRAEEEDRAAELNSLADRMRQGDRHLGSGEASVGG